MERLRTDEMPLAGLVLNRVQVIADTDLSGEQASAGAQRLMEDAGSGPDADSARLAAALLELHAQRMSIAARQRR